MRYRVAFFVGFIATLPLGAQADQPKGDGDPLLVVCKKPESIVGWRLKARAICKSNAEWAQLQKDGMAVAPDGSVVTSEKQRSLNAPVCVTTGGGVNNMNQSNLSPVCF